MTGVDDADRALQAEVLGRLGGWARDLGPPLATAWQALAARLRLDEGRGYFLHPLALPVLQLPAWVAAGHPAVAARGVDAVVQAAEAAAAGYLHVRIQDDLLDEGVGGDPAGTMLGEALAARHHRLALGLGGPAHAAVHEARWLAYADAMAFEATLRGPHAPPLDAAAFTRLLRRTSPLVLPAAALAAPSWPAAVPVLDAIVGHLARSHQLFTDAVDVEKDLRNGNPTWVQVRLGLAAGPAALRRRLVLEGGLDLVVGEALAELDAAEALADSLPLPGLGPWAAARRAVMERARQDVFRALFTALLGG